MYKCKHFRIEELVSQQVFKKYGAEFCWKFFDENLLMDLDTIREFYDSSITINDWVFGGTFSQCGLRCNKDPLVASAKGIYCSAHVLARAFDLHSSDIKKLYKDIEILYNEGKLKAVRRMESPASTKYGWCHIDSFQTSCKGLEIFTA